MRLRVPVHPGLPGITGPQGHSDMLRKAEGAPVLPSHLVLVPGDSTAQGAESALRPGGAPVTPLYLAGSVLAPEGWEGGLGGWGQQGQRPF